MVNHNNRNKLSFYRTFSFIPTLFPDSASDTMDLIIWFHHNCMFAILVVFFVVTWFCFDLMIEFGIISYFGPTHTPSDSLASRKDTLLLRQVNHGTVLEIVWTVIPIFILVSIAIPSFTLLYYLDELTDPSLTVKIIGHQWYWTYEYSDYSSDLSFDSYPITEDDLELGQLRLLEVDNILWLPSHVNIRFLVTSDDVLHSWSIPAFGVKMDCVPGRLNQVSMLAKREGLFTGQCSELCGTGHGFMPIQAKVVPLQLFNGWIESKIGSTHVNTSSLVEGSEPRSPETTSGDDISNTDIDNNGNDDNKKKDHVSNSSGPDTSIQPLLPLVKEPFSAFRSHHTELIHAYVKNIDRLVEAEKKAGEVVIKSIQLNGRHNIHLFPEYTIKFSKYDKQPDCPSMTVVIDYRSLQNPDHYRPDLAPVWSKVTFPDGSFECRRNHFELELIRTISAKEGVRQKFVTELDNLIKGKDLNSISDKDSKSVDKDSKSISDEHSDDSKTN